MGDPASPRRDDPDPDERQASPERASEPSQPQSGSNMRLAGLGMELAGAVVGGCLLGYWMDRRSGTSPRWLIVFSIIGVVGGLYNLIRQALQETGGTRQNRDRTGRPGTGAGT